jgi:predicted small lipoprotein YifL
MRRLSGVFTALTLFAVLAALPACGKRGALKLPYLSDAIAAAHMAEGQG